MANSGKITAKSTNVVLDPFFIEVYRTGIQILLLQSPFFTGVYGTRMDLR